MKGNIYFCNIDLIQTDTYFLSIQKTFKMAISLMHFDYEPKKSTTSTKFWVDSN